MLRKIIKISVILFCSIIFIYSVCSVYFTSNSIAYNFDIMLSFFKTRGKIAFSGPDGWIFYRPDLSVLLKPWKHANQNSNVIISLNDTINKLGIQLFVVPVPNKEDIIQSYSHFNVDISSNQKNRFIRRLRTKNVKVIDLTSIFIANKSEEQMYRKADTHWDQQGIMLGARAISSEINKYLGNFTNKTEYLLKDTTVVEQNDLSLMMGDSNFYGRKCKIVLNKDKSFFSDSDGKIMIFGDSFTNANKKFGSGIGAFISYFTNQPSYTRFCLRCNVQGPRLLLKYLKAQKVKPKVIVWVFSSRFLDSKIEAF